MLIARPCTGVRLDARPGQGRPRGGVWPTAKLPRAQKNTRKSRATCPGIGFLLAQFRERKSRATFAGIAWCADRTPVHRRPTGRPARSGPPSRSREAKPNCRERKKARKSRATCPGIAWCADRTPVHRRRPAPAAYAAPPRRRLANGQTAASAKKHAQKSCNFCWNCLVC